MGKIVLLAVAAAWAAVLIPPLVRSRVENRPNSSVTDFRRQLSTLQRAVPTRSMVPMRSMGRPLTSSPTQRAISSRPGSGLSAMVHAAHLPVAVQRGRAGGPVLERRSPAHGLAHGGAHRQVHRHHPSPRELARRRRVNVLVGLTVAVGVTMFLAATTKSSAMVYSFALAFVALCGYCYKLVQLRNAELYRRDDEAWFSAA